MGREVSSPRAKLTLKTLGDVEQTQPALAAAEGANEDCCRVNPRL